MTRQPDLFDPPYAGKAPRQRHSATSTAAAEKIRPRLGPLHRTLLRVLQVNPGGCTDERLCTLTGMGQNTERPRRRELELKGYVVNSGRTDRLRSGREAVVWVIAAAHKNDLFEAREHDV